MLADLPKRPDQRFMSGSLPDVPPRGEALQAAEIPGVRGDRLGNREIGTGCKGPLPRSSKKNLRLRRHGAPSWGRIQASRKAETPFFPATTTHLNLFCGCSPPQRPTLLEPHRTRGFPNHGSFSFGLQLVSPMKRRCSATLGRSQGSAGRTLAVRVGAGYLLSRYSVRCMDGRHSGGFDP